jgi:deferrochelatase/peroxidase EfeB
MMNEKGTVMKYAIYQLPFENQNSRDLYFMNAKQIEEISDQFEMVAHVEARTMDEVFRIANFICESDADLIEVVGKMHSLSVGDIVHNLETDETFVVASFGFDKIDMKECV